MINRKILLLVPVIMIAIVAGFTRCKKTNPESYRFQFQFITEEYKPLNYTENGKLTGLAPELLKEVCRQLDIPFGVSVLPWDQGYAKVLQQIMPFFFRRS